MFLLTCILSFFLGNQILRTIIYKQPFFNKNLLPVFSFGTGLGLTSFINFLSVLIIGYEYVIFSLTIQLLFLIVLVFFNTFVLKINDIFFTLNLFSKNDFKRNKFNLLFILTISLIFLFILIFLLRSYLHPYGGWDTWAIWNLHAKYLFTGGKEWTKVFSPYLVGSHQDYPWLLPSLVAYGWQLTGSDTAFIPIGIGFFYSIATILLLYTFLWDFTSKKNAHIGVIAFLSNLFLVTSASSQQADIIFGFYCLCAMTIWLISLLKEKMNKNLFYLLGLQVGFALFTKNEGYLLFLVIGGLIFIKNNLEIKKKAELIGSYFLGSVPFLLINNYVNLQFHLSNYLFNAKTIEIISKNLLNLSRYIFVLEKFILSLFWFDMYLLNIPLVIFLLLFFKNRTAIRHTQIYILLPIFLMLSGYFMIYIITPINLVWHIEHSLNRLLIQLWPSMVCAGCIFIVKLRYKR